MSDYPNARDCEHGYMRGKCVYCDLAECEAELAEARAATDANAETSRDARLALFIIAVAALVKLLTWNSDTSAARTGEAFEQGADAVELSDCSPRPSPIYGEGGR